MKTPAPVAKMLVPQVPPEGKRRALDLAGLRIVLALVGDADGWPLEKVTDASLRAVAERVAAVADPGERANEVFRSLAELVRVLREAQAVARLFADTADRLDTLHGFLLASKRLWVERADGRAT